MREPIQTHGLKPAVVDHLCLRNIREMSDTDIVFALQE